MRGGTTSHCWPRRRRPLLLTARTLFGVFGSATNPAAQAYVADRTSREERMDEIATLTSGFTLGQVAGPAAAGVLMGGAVIMKQHAA